MRWSEKGKHRKRGRTKWVQLKKRQVRREINGNRRDRGGLSEKRKVTVKEEKKTGKNKENETGEDE